jgi:hypothetical protein
MHQIIALHLKKYKKFLERGTSPPQTTSHCGEENPSPTQDSSRPLAAEPCPPIGSIFWGLSLGLEFSAPNIQILAMTLQRKLNIYLVQVISS